MTGRVPVERTISDAYRFAFTRFFSILGTIWLPYLLLAVIVIGLIRLMAPDLLRMIAARDFDVGAAMGLLRLVVLVAIFAFIVGSMVTVGLQRKAMGVYSGPAYVFFSLGAPVWRMAGASFLAAIVIGVIALVAALACLAIWSAVAGLGGVGMLIRVLVVLVAVSLLIYIVLRLTFFLPAVVVSENSIGLERAWILSGHNFWRILIVVIAILLPVAIAFHLVSWALFGPVMSWHGLGGRVGLRELLRAGLLQYGAKGSLMLLVQLVERIVVLGVFNGAIASAYLAVTREPPPAAAPAAATL